MGEDLKEVRKGVTLVFGNGVFGGGIVSVKVWGWGCVRRFRSSEDVEGIEWWDFIWEKE